MSAFIHSTISRYVRTREPNETFHTEERIKIEGMRFRAYFIAFDFMRGGGIRTDTRYSLPKQGRPLNIRTNLRLHDVSEQSHVQSC